MGKNKHAARVCHTNVVAKAWKGFMYDFGCDPLLMDSSMYERQYVCFSKVGAALFTGQKYPSESSHPCAYLGLRKFHHDLTDREYSYEYSRVACMRICMRFCRGGGDLTEREQGREKLRLSIKRLHTYTVLRKGAKQENSGEIFKCE